MCVFQKSATVEEETNDDELYKNIVERASGYTDYPYYPRVPTTSALRAMASVHASHAAAL